MHKVLSRQLRKLGLDGDAPPDADTWLALLAAIDSSYEEADKTRYRLERALSISSEESRAHGDRQSALARCAHALLSDEGGNAEDSALEELISGLGATGAWIARRSGGGVLVADVGEPSASTLPQSELSDPTGAWAWAPIDVAGEWVGTLGVHGAAGTRVAVSDRELVTTVATMVGAHWARSDARDELEALIESKDRFVASVSHELRTPLTAVVGFGAELQARWHAFSPQEARDLVDLIVEQAEDVSNMVEDLLVVGRADIGKLSLQPEVLDVRRQVEMASARSSMGQVRIEGNGEASADPLRVRQIVRNLLTNAARYGGPRVRVRIVTESAFCQVEVRDDGEGVPEEAVARIFEPFESAHLVPTQPGSVGLGLWVARRLADLMGGGLQHRREHGETVFSLTLPVPAGRPDRPHPAGTAGTRPGS
jgi:signal transduction histidine kinase